MRAVRHIAVALVTLALAFVPAVGFAAMRATQHEMSIGAQEHAYAFFHTASHAADICILKCCSAPAVLVETQPLAAMPPVAAADRAAVALSPFARPPPPRS